MKQRGYNLIEAFIALTVLGIVIGGALIPLQSRLQQEEIQSAKRLLSKAQEALYGYALSHKTSARKIIYFDKIQYDIPASRPYMPCPDIDGDGAEDRTALPVASIVSTVDLESAGVCVEQKGMLPWRTLGIQELDPWGNHLTYRIDKKYSSELFGFDETFFADIFNFADAIAYPSGDPEYAIYSSRDESSSVICTDMYDNASTGGCPNLKIDNIGAGIYTNALLTLGARIVTPYTSINDVVPSGSIDGPLFVIVSHGRDGKGAINRANQCRAAPRITNNLIEVANAYYATGHPFLSAPFDCTALTGTSATLHENVFVSTPISDIVNDDVDAPDDIVVWGGTRQMYGFLARSGGLPIDRLEYLSP